MLTCNNPVLFFSSLLLSAIRSTINVEHAIAQETLREAKQLAEEFQELHGMMHDFKTVVYDQNPSIDHIVNNVENSQQCISRGTADVRQAKKLSRFGIG